MSIALLQFLLIAISLALGVGLLTFWAWMLLDCISRESRAGHDRLVWTLAIVFTKFFGAAAYYFVRYRRRASA